MRAQVKTQPNTTLSVDKVTLSCKIKYYSKSDTGFPGGRVSSYYSNTTALSKYINHITKP